MLQKCNFLIKEKFFSYYYLENVNEGLFLHQNYVASRHGSKVTSKFVIKLHNWLLLHKHNTRPAITIKQMS